jgi:hypothetical protein
MYLKNPIDRTKSGSVGGIKRYAANFSILKEINIKKDTP